MYKQRSGNNCLQTGKNSIVVAKQSLPSAAISLVGREDDRARIIRLITEEKARIITLTGPGGVGKTTLSLDVARALEQRFDDGAYFVALDKLASSEQVPQAIRQTLGIEGSQPLADTLRDRELLLVLDNLEHIIDASSFIEELVQDIPALVVLTTSRERMNILGEYEYPLAPLGLPDASAQNDTIGLSPAVQLFVRNAKRYHPSFVPTKENIATIAEICRSLDGLPLAIELACARLKVLSLSDLNKRLTSSIELLSGQNRSLPDRQRTIRNTIEWSYELFNEKEQELLRRLGIFRASFTLFSLEAIYEGKSDDLLELLGSLIDKSIIFRVSAERYSMLHIIREFAIEKLGGEEERAILTERLAHYYIETLKKNIAHLPADEAKKLRQLVDDEYPTIRSVIFELTRTKKYELAARLASRMSTYWIVRHLSPEGIRFSNDIYEHKDVLSHEVLAYLLGCLGQLYNALGKTEEGQLAYESAAKEARLSGNNKLTVWMLQRVGIQLANLSRFEEAKKIFAETKALNDSMGEERQQHMTEELDAVIAATEGRLQDALRYFEPVVEHTRPLGRTLDLGTRLRNVGVMKLGLGEYDEGERIMREAEEISEELGDRSGVFQYKVHIAILCHYKRGTYKDALSPLAYCIRYHGDAFDENAASRLSLYAADSLLRMGKYEEAAMIYHYARKRDTSNYFSTAFVDPTDPDLGETIKKKLGANKFDEIANKNALPNAIAVAELLDDMAGRKKDDAGNDLYDLSAREQEILAFVAKGHSDSEIADTLFISIRTVQAHLRSIYSKLGVKNRTAAVHLAQEKKLL